jgi:hypothetical protein
MPRHLLFAQHRRKDRRPSQQGTPTIATAQVACMAPHLGIQNSQQRMDEQLQPLRPDELVRCNNTLSHSQQVALWHKIIRNLQGLHVTVSPGFGGPHRSSCMHGTTPMHRKFLMATDRTASVFVILTLTNNLQLLYRVLAARVGRALRSTRLCFAHPCAHSY